MESGQITAIILASVICATITISVVVAKLLAERLESLPAARAGSRTSGS